MIDSIGFKVLISNEAYSKLLEQAVMTQRIDKRTGDVEFEYHNTKLDFLSPSWNYKVACRVTDVYWAYDRDTKHPFKATGKPNITFEYSVPKIFFGHNITPVGSCLIYKSMHQVKELFEAYFKIELPEPNDWYCYRIDTCANYTLENEEQVRLIIRYLQRLNYPRKIKNSYEDTGIYFPSRHNTLKIYAKGPEFKKHDFERFKEKEQALEYLLAAQRTLRIEVEHRKSLAYIIKKYEIENHVFFKKFENLTRMADLIEIFNFEVEMKRVMSKMLCGTETKIMDIRNVLLLLKNHYEDVQARSFHQIYMYIITQGQKEARQSISKSTYYRALREFRKLGISLLVTNSDRADFFIDKGFPNDFSLNMDESNKYYQLPVCEVNYLNDSDAEGPF